MKTVYEGEQRFQEDEGKIDSNNFKTAEIEADISVLRKQLGENQNHPTQMKDEMKEEVHHLNECMSTDEHVV